jgi:uncharacterized protein
LNLRAGTLTIWPELDHQEACPIRKRDEKCSPSTDCREALWRKRLAVEQRHEAARRRRALLLGQASYPSLETFLRVLGLFRRGNANASRFELKRLDLRFHTLPPAFDGFRVLHVSDLHIGKREPDFPRQVRDFLASVEADICVFTGDSRFEHSGDSDHVLEGMRTILSPIRCRHGVFAVLGNHDRSQFVAPFREMGIRVLINEHARLEQNGGHIWIVGVDDAHLFECDHLPVALDGIPAGEFKLLLAHSPEVALEAASLGVDCYLCGHTHWGQIRLPVLGALQINARCPRKFTRGLWSHNGLQGYTTAGIGTTDVPVRFNCPPEAALITLRTET